MIGKILSGISEEALLEPAGSVTIEVAPVGLEARSQQFSGQRESEESASFGLVIFGPDKFPFAANSVDAIAGVRIAERSANPEEFLREVARVLAIDGRLLLRERVAPAPSKRGKQEMSRWLNALLRLRDTAHITILDRNSWHMILYQAGFVLENERRFGRRMTFEEWTADCDLTPVNIMRLRAMLVQAPEKIAAFLTLTIGEDRITFSHVEMVFAARKR